MTNDLTPHQERKQVAFERYVVSSMTAITALVELMYQLDIRTPGAARVVELVNESKIALEDLLAAGFAEQLDEL